MIGLAVVVAIEINTTYQTTANVSAVRTRAGVPFFWSVLAGSGIAERTAGLSASFVSLSLPSTGGPSGFFFLRLKPTSVNKVLNRGQLRAVENAGLYLTATQHACYLKWPYLGDGHSCDRSMLSGESFFQVDFVLLLKRLLKVVDADEIG